jgi:hypothetical protein
MEDKTNFDEQGQTGVNRLTGGDLRETPVNESSRASELIEMSSPPAHTLDGLPARRIELRYWAALLALGLAIWAAIIFWLL